MACHNNTAQDANKLGEVKIGNQVWAATNLDVVVFRNGDTIPEIRSAEEWKKAGEEGRPAWCYYENDGEKWRKFGRMYNWHAVNDPRGLCPEGWHVPSNEEWITLETYYGIPDVGFRLKSSEGWNANGNGDNTSKLFILPGGYRSRDGNFTGAGEFIYLSGSTEDRLADSKDNKIFIWGRGLQFETRGMMRCGLDKEFGLYVRCIKNTP
jgi:uncharacterized protein (TIGR02145 family)